MRICFFQWVSIFFLSVLDRPSEQRGGSTAFKCLFLMSKNILPSLCRCSYRVRHSLAWVVNGFLSGQLYTFQKHCVMKNLYEEPMKSACLKTSGSVNKRRYLPFSCYHAERQLLGTAGLPGTCPSSGSAAGSSWQSEDLVAFLANLPGNWKPSNCTGCHYAHHNL